MLLDCTKQKDINNDLDKFDQAIFNAKIARDKVKKYIKRMENSSNKQRELAKQFLKSSSRDKAKMALSRSKVFETQVEVGQGQLNMLEQQIVQIDQAKSVSGALKALKRVILY